MATSWSPLPPTRLLGRGNYGIRCCPTESFGVNRMVDLIVAPRGAFLCTAVPVVVGCVKTPS